jgi:hypothetical protein
MEPYECGHESTDEGRTEHVIVHAGRTYLLCNECAESFDYENPPRAGESE